MVLRGLRFRQARNPFPLTSLPERFVLQVEADRNAAEWLETQARLVLDDASVVMTTPAVFGSAAVFVLERRRGFTPATLTSCFGGILCGFVVETRQ